MIKKVRNLGVSFRRDGAFIRLSGYIDEFADYGSLFAEKLPLKLILREIVAVNSHGIRKWTRFIQDFGVKGVELHEVPGVFIDAANLIPEMVSTSGNANCVKSVVTPYGCLSCQKEFDLVVATSSVVLAGGAFEILSQSCPRCGGKVELSVDPEDHFMFLTGA